MKFLPQRLRVSSFGDGGFRFGDYSHKGHLLVVPSGMRAWDGTSFSGILAEKGDIEFVIIGTGDALRRFEAALVANLESQGLNVDQMATSAAVHTYNLMLGESRRVAAALIAVP